MTRSTVLFVGAIGAAAALGGAQQPRMRARVPVEVTGSVSGHVYCSDTNLPARIASVALQPINVAADRVAGAKQVQSDGIRLYQTGLDGGFLIPKVKPGTYYAVIDMPGYLSPITAFKRAELQQPTPEILARVMKVVPIVTVEASHTATLEVRIERGASLTGTIRYDDGTPVAAVAVAPLSREMKGKKESWVSSQSYIHTNDQGYYRLTGLPAGEYLPRVNLDLEDRVVDRVVGNSQGSWSSTRYSLSFYAGDTTRESKGKPIKLAAGEERDRVDIIIPVSKLHSVSGSITEVGSGHIINAGKATLSYEDGTQIVSADVDKDDSEFHFGFVPEDTYVLAVTEVREVTREEVPNEPGSMPPSETKETTVREYGTQKQPLLVESDVTGVVVAVSPKTGKAAGTQLLRPAVQ